MKKVLLAFFISSCLYAQEVTVTYQQHIDSARSLAKEFFKENKIAGMAIAVSKNNAIIWSEGFGYSDLESKSMVDPATTKFRIASISKSLTAAALAKLMDDGLIKLDASLYTYLPNYPKKKYDFTLRQIGGHIAGIRHYRGSEFILNKKMDITQGLDIFKDDPLLFEPQSKYRYSTYGWNLLSEVIQKTADTPFNSYMERQIFSPLKMNHTASESSDVSQPSVTKFYIKTNAGKVVLGPEVNNEFKVAGGGFLSTAEDLIRFGNEIIAPKILSDRAVSELLKEQKTKDGKGINYGVGFKVSTSQAETPKFGHSGGGIGASTLLLIYPQEQLVISILVNVSGIAVRDIGKKLEAVFINN